jgi:hypothetical protein
VAASYSVVNEILQAVNNVLSVGGIFCDFEMSLDCVNHGNNKINIWKWIKLRNSAWVIQVRVLRNIFVSRRDKGTGDPTRWHMRVKVQGILGDGTLRVKVQGILGDGTLRVKVQGTIGDGTLRVKVQGTIGDGTLRVKVQGTLGDGTLRVKVQGTIGDGTLRIFVIRTSCPMLLS